MFWSARSTRLAMFAPLVAGITLATASCGDDSGTDEDDDPADAIVTLRLAVGNQTVNFAEGGTVTGGPIVISGTTNVAATFLDASGAQVTGLQAFELRITPTNTALVAFDRVGAFSGSLRKIAAGSTQLRVDLWHIQENHSDFGGSVTINIL